MEKKEDNTVYDPDLSITAALRTGTGHFLSILGSKSKMLVASGVLISLAVASALTGNIGSVHVAPVSYIPYHEIGMAQFLRYAAGFLVSLVLYIFWRSVTFSLMADDGKAPLKSGDMRYSFLRMLQYFLLSFLTYGILAAALVYCAVRFSAWIFVALGAYFLVMAVPFFISEYGYMAGDMSYSKALKRGFSELKRRGGTVWLRMVSLDAVMLLLSLICLLPAVSLMMGVYDNATAQVMESAGSTPAMLYVLEFVFWLLGTAALLAVILWGACVLGVIIYPPERAKTGKSTGEIKGLLKK